ncbi:GIY-YIG nuclease family protein [Nocardioides sp. AX2bis]|uniref:GIY-YIG nuclease family protein n=1 Tax=Nocardioides sp. AX2bis TaxID=2653157 RepID=UPI0012F3BE27|nr:hypothetical protein [Nocardioides sp. AX2bis]VXC29828.1 conserved hypothetical protein [Nocardioides sp. AX2bis]
MVDPDAVDAALHALAGPRHARAEAADVVARERGLYAFHGSPRAWSDLGLEPQLDDQPLYVGKAEASLRDRDVGTHFATGRTGSSTVRRSLAALLVDRLDLVAVPRNLARPDGSASFGLEPRGDLRLSEWMERHLLLATWIGPGGVLLGEVETAVLLRLRPPLNLAKVGEPRVRLKAARAQMARTARAYPPGAVTSGTC